MILSTEQLKMIRDQVSQHINISSLQDDVIDHLCCVVERRLEKGTPFEMAVKDALTELAPHGLSEIQKETIVLLDNQTTLHMKKVMYAVGLLSTMIMSLGWLFRFLRWPGGDEMANYGFFGFALLFLPMLAVSQFKISIHKTFYERLRILLGLFSGLITSVSVVFKMNHLMGTDFLFLSGAGIFIFGFLPVLFFTMYKKSTSKEPSL
jgi:hypothetical protein